MDETLHQRFQAICRQNGWKCTAQRFAVYAFIQENYNHPGVDGVWQSVQATLPTVTRESIYRILNEFAARGLIRRLDHIENARYDWQVAPHGHFLCTQCGEIQDFPLSVPVEVPTRLIAGDIEHTELRLTGICRRCRKRPPSDQDRSS